MDGGVTVSTSGVSMRWDILGGLSAGLNDGRPDEQAIALVRRGEPALLSARNGCGYGIQSVRGSLPGKYVVGAARGLGLGTASTHDCEWQM